MSPGDIGPESNSCTSLGCGSDFLISLAVIVCIVESSFVHETIFPDDTISTGETNASLLLLFEFEFDAAGVMNTDF